MNYRVLARKWRPQKFNEIVGQNHIIKAITQSFLLKKIHHAYILIGMRGVGKTTIARLIAKGLNCEQQTISTICGKCKNCTDIELGCFIDLIEIDAASRTKVEETRDFLNNVQYTPSIGRFKVYLIDEIHMLSKHSFNALLKVLEEPPEHVKFILITTEHKKIPETVLSRCLQFYLKPLSVTQIVTQLTYIFNKENIIAEELALESLAYAAKGSMRDALNLSEQAIILGNNTITSNVINNMFGIINIEHPLLLIECLIDGNIHNILNQINNYSILGINWDNLLAEMLIVLQKIAINQFLSNSLTIQKNEHPTYNINKRIHALSNRIAPENVQLYYQILLLGRRELPYAPNDRIGIEMTMLRALAFKPTTNVTKNKNDNKNIKKYITMKNSKFDISRNLKKNNQVHQDLDLDRYQKQSKYKSNNLLYLDLKHNENNFDKIESNNLNTLSVEKKFITSDITKTLINARLTLSKNKEYSKLKNKIQQKKNLTIKSKQKISKNILERFSNINTNINNNKFIAITNIDSTIYNDTKNINNIHKKNKHVIPFFIKEILRQAIKEDPWILQIYRSSLPILAKKLIMNSWKEQIDKNKICLHVRSNYYHLNSNELHNIIQNFIFKYIGNSTILNIKKDDNFTIKTPMEYIYTLYKAKILKTKQEFLNDPYVKIIKKFFDAEYNENNFEII